jgi:hypothetical protein
LIDLTTNRTPSDNCKSARNQKDPTIAASGFEDTRIPEYDNSSLPTPAENIRSNCLDNSGHTQRFQEQVHGIICGTIACNSESTTPPAFHPLASNIAVAISYSGIKARGWATIP